MLQPTGRDPGGRVLSFRNTKPATKGAYFRTLASVASIHHIEGGVTLNVKFEPVCVARWPQP
jgi:hypothetical protein